MPQNCINIKPIYSVVVPMYNEEETIFESYRQLKSVMDGVGEPYELIFVNDGSRDKCADIVRGIAKDDKNVRMIDFSRNFGHQTAITAGTDLSSGDAVVVIDADLQDPPSVIPRMIEKWKEGFEVVYGVRGERKGETAFKKMTASLFYRFLKSMTDIDIPVDTGDFRLIDRKVVDVFLGLTEKNRYVRGLISWVGFRQIAVEYVREERFAGKTKYSLQKMLKFAGDGITSFSHKPLKISTALGALFCGVSALYFAYALIALIAGVQTSPYAAVIFAGMFTNGVVLAMIGVAGQYIGRIYDESKNRPLYIIREKVGFYE